MTAVMTGTMRALASWPARRWLTVAIVAVVTVVVTAVPTAMIPTPVFGREIPPTPWSWPVLLVSAVLIGMVAATYVARRDTASSTDRGTRLGALGAFTTFFAVGCPVCNKLVLLALGYSGAMQYFAPVQPVLAAMAVVVLVWALITRIRREDRCPVGRAEVKEQSAAV